ncbi:hypothetical protein [Microbacterium imperiale]|nr:hypothetical protein [Microbacterium imperiale]MBP2420865.1 hypothetical protein [Microbacterium imperiale]MDS0200020.1 hypothetical protein [Microbacterium imperiale]
MTKTRRLPREVPPGAALLGLIAVMTTVAGCSVVDNLAYGRAETTYDDARSLAQARGDVPEWLPSDARSIQRVASTRDETAESLVFVSDDGLTGCEEVPRESAPTMEVDAAPDVYEISSVFACGTWAVAQQDGTFYAWTPAAEAEAEDEQP